MTYSLIVRHEAQIDIQNAFDWYGHRSEGLGDDFLHEIERCLLAVRTNPFAYQAIYREVHRAVLFRFPYAIFYRVRRNTVSILACFHVRRRPDAWSERF